jgi:enterochelin esterase-like enzyme
MKISPEYLIFVGQTSKHRMKQLLLFTFLLIASAGLQGQQSLFSRQDITLYSAAFEDSITFDLYLPESYEQASDKTGFPVIVLFDNQNEQTHAYNVHSIELLNMHAQIPDVVVVGVPFTMQNRLYRTSPPGIEKTERLLFDELLPHLAARHKAGGPRILVGHSRTAFLTSYLMLKRYGEFDVAASFSGFIDKGFSFEEIKTFLGRIASGDEHMRYYFSAGDTREEAPYLADYRALSEWLVQAGETPNFQWSFSENKALNHLTNYNLSLPSVLVDYFAPYNAILDDWLQDKVNRLPGDQVLSELKSDFGKVSQMLHTTLYPNPIHIYSLASHYYYAGDLKTALAVFEYGYDLYPGDEDLALNRISILREMGEEERARQLEEEIRN